ncbi:MAG: hypothetical protein EOO89_31495, partial [Pedobacter sp.]
MDRLSLDKGVVYYGSEYPTFLVDTNGDRKSITAQYVNVTDPTPDGLVLSGYIVLKKNPEKIQEQEDCLLRKKIRDAEDDHLEDNGNASTLGDETA